MKEFKIDLFVAAIKIAQRHTVHQLIDERLIGIKPTITLRKQPTFEKELDSRL